MSMQIEFLIHTKDIISNWGELKPLFHAVVSRAAYGEFSVDDLYSLALDGKIRVGLVRESGVIIMALAFEFRHYPQKLAINYLAMGGKKANEVMAHFLGTFKKWAADAGVDRIEASCSKAMARILARNHFVTTYQLVRLDLKNKGETT